MARSITLNGTSYSIPQTGDSGWSLTGGVDDYLVALSSGVLTKAGGTFTLTAEINTGATYGLKTAYFKTQTANPAAAGVLRLAKTDTVSWRNNANGADLALGINGSDLPTFNSIALVDISTAQTLTNKTLTNPAIANINNGSASGIAIPQGASDNFALLGAAQTLSNKLMGVTNTLTGVTMASFTPDGGTHTLTAPTVTDTLVAKTTTDTLTNKTMDGGSNTFTNLPATGITGSVTPAHGGTGQDFSASTGLVKVAAGTMSAATLVNADVSSSAAIAYSKLALTGAILNADLAGSIAYSKLSLTGAILNADLAGSIAYSKLVLTGSIATGDMASGLLVPITKGGTGQTTANAALNALLPSQTSANGKVLTSNGTDTSWAAALTTSLTSAHIFVGNAGVATDTAVTGDVTISASGVTAIGSAKVTDAMLAGSITGSKVGTVTQSVAGVVASAGQLLGTNANTDASAGNVGEYVSSTQALQGVNLYATGASTNYFDIVSISLTAGDWDVTGVVSVDLNGVTTFNYANMGISTASGNSGTGLTVGDNYIAMPVPTTLNQSSGCLANWRHKVANGSTDTVYLKCRLNYSGGTPTAGGRLSARRSR